MKRTIVKPRRDAGGRPLCNGRPGCRFPRGSCPMHAHRVGERPTLELSGVPHALTDLVNQDIAQVEPGHFVAPKPKLSAKAVVSAIGAEMVASGVRNGNAAEVAVGRALLQATGDALPEGWAEDGLVAIGNIRYRHSATGISVWRSQDWKRWLDSRTPGMRYHATRAEAMAAALGFTIDGDAAHGYCYLRDDFPRDHEQTVMADAESAAINALAFDAEQRRQAKPAATIAPSDDIVPAGWVHNPTASYPRSYRHTATGEDVFFSDYGRWLSCSTDAGDRKPTLAECCAAALGFEIYEVVGDTWKGWCWKRDSDCCVEHAGKDRRADWSTPEIAAYAACEFDTKQRAAQAKSKSIAFAVGDLVRCVNSSPNELIDGHVYRVNHVCVRLRDHITVEGVDGNWHTSRFVRVAPTEVPPGFRDVGYGAYQHGSDRFVGSVSGASRWWWQRENGDAPVCDNAPTFHEACMRARGLERIEQLWSTP